MAAIQEQSAKGRYAHKKAHIDMTPMVDLGFLLITFFIFTNSMEDTKALKYNEPADGEPMKVKCGTTITLKLSSVDSIGYIECINGIDQPMQFVKLDNHQGLRQLLREKQLHVGKLSGDPNDLFVIIRPMPECNYQLLIDVIDEMTINEVTRYSVVEG